MLKRISQLASINRLQNWCYIQGDGNKSWWASQLSPGPPSLCSSPSRGTRPNRSLRRADAPPGTSWGLRSAFCSARATPSPRSAPPPALPHSYLAAATMTMTLPHQSVAVVVCSKPSSSSQARFEISSPPVSSPVLSFSGRRSRLHKPKLWHDFGGGHLSLVFSGLSPWPALICLLLCWSRCKLVSHQVVSVTPQIWLWWHL